MNDEQRKLQARCSNVGMVVRVVFWLCALILMFQIGVILWLSILPSSQYLAVKNNDQSVTISIANWKEWLPAGLINTEKGMIHKKAAFLVNMVTHWIAFALGNVILWHLRNLFKRIDEIGNPFQTACVKDLRNAACFMMALSIIPAFFEVFLLIGLGLAGSAALSGEVMHARIVWLFAGGMILCLVQIFRYGCALQMESDETL